MAAAALERSGLGALLRLAPAWRGLVVLNYHRIGTPGDSPLDRDLWNASVEDFDAQVAFLARNFDVVGPEDTGPGAAGRRVLITFDDGYRDNHAAALPILRAHGATATFFLATGFLDRSRLAWWDEVAWMVRTSARERICVDGVAVALDPPDRRGRGHPPGPREDAARQRPRRLPRPRGAGDRHGPRPGRRGRRAVDDVAHGARAARSGDDRRRAHRQPSDPGEPRRRLPAGGDHGLPRAPARRARDPDALVQLPNGDRGSFDARTRALLAEAGVERAFSFDGGFVRRGAPWDPYDVPRIAVGPRTAGPAFAATVTLPQVFIRPPAGSRG